MKINNKLKKLKIKIFADGADIKDIQRLYKLDIIKGLTTNPTLMRNANILDYEKFAREVLNIVRDKPISFEVFADNFDEMNEQARKIAEWQENVYVKIPITNTKSLSATELIKKLSNDGVKVNVTAVMTVSQVEQVEKALNRDVPSYISIFAGRIADTGIDPSSTIVDSLSIVNSKPKTEIIWASPRELLNIFQANDVGCHAITVTTNLLEKLHLIDYNLQQYSLDTVKMFYEDAKNSGYSL